MSMVKKKIVLIAALSLPVGAYATTTAIHEDYGNVCTKKVTKKPAAPKPPKPTTTP